MAQISAHPLSSKSNLHRLFSPGDFLDCYATRSDLPARAAAKRITAFPGWAGALVQLRNLLVVPLGLKAEGPGDGEKMGPFPVTEETPDEIIAGFDDKHLNFRVSVRSEGGLVTLATWVHPHNLGGRAYLTAIMPFHILIARNALRRLAAA